MTSPPRDHEGEGTTDHSDDPTGTSGRMHRRRQRAALRGERRADTKRADDDDDNRNTMQPRRLQEYRNKRRDLHRTWRKAKRKRWSEEGCTKAAQGGGLCIRHGAPVKRCSHEGCTNGAVRRGLCIRHGAQVKQCSHEGCTNGAVRAHCALICSHNGCMKLAQRGGICIAHGEVVARSKQRSPGGCDDSAVRGGLRGKPNAKPHASAASGEMDEHYRSSGEYEAMSMAVSAVVGGHGKIDEASSTLRSAPFYLDSSDDEDELGAWIWKASRTARLFGSNATTYI